MNRTDFVRQKDLLYLMGTTQRNNWFVSLENSIQHVTAEQASWKKKENENSIWEIIKHNNFYLNRYLDRFDGNPVHPIENNESSFKHVHGESWTETKEKLSKLLSEWNERIAGADQETLERAVDENGNANWHEVLADIALHAAYHAGQIITILKQNDWWDPENGVH